MKNPEEAIQKVLAGLRDSETPAGMEHRILETLQHRASQPHPAWRRLRPAWLTAPAHMIATTPMICGFALAGIFAVVLTISAIHRPGHPTAHSTPATTPTASSLSKPSFASAKAKRPSSQVRGVQGTETGTAPQTEPLNPGSDESTALSEMQAASYPAPPMPLTEQEKILLRIAHRGNPVELAMLVPSLRALQEAEENAEFQRFFGQSTKQAMPAPPVTEQIEQVPPPQPTPEQSQPETEQSSPAQPIPAQPETDKPTSDQPDTQQPAPPQPGTGEHQ